MQVPAPSPLATIPPAAELLTPAEAARLLSMTPQSLANAASHGRLPYVRTPGGRYRYPKAPLLRMRAAAGDAARLRANADLGRITRAEATERLLAAGHDLTSDEAAMMIGGVR